MSSIKICTYSNPYEIISMDNFNWDDIQKYPHFCVSQTLVNGMEVNYPYFKHTKNITTVKVLLNSFYSDWEDFNTKVRQIMEVDSIICQQKYDENITRALEHNLNSLVSSIRIFKELGIDPDEINTDVLTHDQKLLVDIYKIINEKEHSSFDFLRVKEEEDVEAKIEKALKNANPDIDMEKIDTSAVVIHGVHQFSASLLCAIHDISCAKDVILLINYQENNHAIYDTWKNIYSCFDHTFGNAENADDNKYGGRPDKVKDIGRKCYSSKMLAYCISSLANGEYTPLDEDARKYLKVTEFENTTEFANYCADMYKKAKKKQYKLYQDGKSSSIFPVNYMEERLYSASTRVNGILRAYFPECFGERNFLDYPIGHFFVSAVNMWDYKNKTVRIEKMSDIKDCLIAGIIPEEKTGKLLNTFNTVESFINKETSLDRIIELLGELTELVRDDDEDLKRIAYLNADEDDIKDLIAALKDINETIHGFFSDLDKGGNNIDIERFYKRIHQFIAERIEKKEDLDKNLKEIIEQLQNRLKEINLPDSGSFTCLKQTMSYYFSQENKPGQYTGWIVKDFEQLYGDILRSNYQKDVYYHFCCLSDKDISAANDEILPWPLDINFFDNAYRKLGFRYNIFLKSKKEYKNYKRFALFYGLSFNRLPCKLSYVKTDGNNDNELYHLISMLGIEVEKYSYPYEKKWQSSSDGELQCDYELTEVDLRRYKMCPYRFALESIVQGRTVYRSHFLITWYIRMLLQNAVTERFKDKNTEFSEDNLGQFIQEEYEILDKKIRITNEFEKTMIIDGVYRQMLKNYEQNNQKPSESDEQKEIRKDFLVISQDKINIDEYDSVDEDEINDDMCNKPCFRKKTRDYCRYCASKDVCLRAPKEQ